MIPIDPSKPFEYKDKRGNVFYFRYLTDEIIDEHDQIQEDCGKIKNEVERGRKKLDLLIDFFMIDWHGKDFPKFPKDKKPSKFFFGLYKVSLSNVFWNEIYPYITGFGAIDEIKNSSQQQPLLHDQ